MAIWHKLLWSNIGAQVVNPTVGELVRLWTHAETQRAQMPSAAVFNIQTLRAHAPRLMFLKSESNDFRYVHYGTDIQQHSHFDMTGRLVSEFGGEVGEFFLARYREVIAQQRPLYTVHFAERAKSVLTWERLILPLREPEGGVSLLVYNMPLESRHLLLDAVINTSDDSVMVLRPLRGDDRAIEDWLILVVNAGCLALLGAVPSVALADAQGQAVSKVFPRWRELGLAAHCTAGLASSHPIEFAFNMVGSGQAGVRMLNGRVSSLGDGCVIRLVDVTEQKNYEKLLLEARRTAEAASLSKAAFLATMSHEIRTPMNGIIGMTSLLLDTEQTREQQEFTEVIRSSSESLLVIVNDILDYSKIESGQMQLEWNPMDLQDLVESSIDLLSVAAQQKRLGLMYLIDEDVPRWLYGDFTRLRQVLVNLISNALKFTEKGEVLVRVALAPTGESVSLRESLDTRAVTPSEPKAPVALLVSVLDTGIGISDEEQTRLFQPFSQVDSSTSRRFGGTGLGLVICKRLVGAMGGRIWVKSKPQKGTVFKFTFRAEKALAPAPSLGGEPPALVGKRVLLLERSSTHLKVLGALVHRWGMHAHPCTTAQDALAILEADNRFDLVLTATHSQGQEGSDFVQAARVLAPAIAVILLASEHVRTGGDSGHFSAVLVRPVRQSALLEAIEMALGQAPTRLRPPVKQGLFDASLASTRPLRVLLVEDNEVNVKVALRLLSGFGYRADVARDGLEALASVRRQSYDLVLMDIQMPRMDGIEATRCILSEPALGRGAPPRIIGMSANALKDDIDRALASGMDAYITKPIGVAALADVLQTSTRRGSGRISDFNLPEQSNPALLEGSPRSSGFERHTVPAALTASMPAPLTYAAARLAIQAAEPLLDLGALASVLDDDRTAPIVELDPSGEFLDELTQSLGVNVGDLLGKMRAAVAGADASELARLAHQVKGLSANLGVGNLSKTCARIEGLGLSGQLGTAEALIDAATIDLALGVDALRALVARLRSN